LLYSDRFVDECKHYYSGFKLLFLDVRVSSGIVWKVLNGYTLSRRESRYGHYDLPKVINS
jgi:LETM1 and EF-hand domain-containing protein 1